VPAIDPARIDAGLIGIRTGTRRSPPPTAGTTVTAVGVLASVRTGWSYDRPVACRRREELVMGKAARRRTARSPSPRRSAPADDRAGDPREDASAALTRLVRGNPPGRVSLAGAYALGYGALGMAQHDGDGPDWFDQLDPLDTLFLGTAWPLQLRDGYEFGNARTAWLRLMRTTAHWAGIQRFVTEVVRASETHDLPVDAGELMLLVAGRLEAAGLDQRKLPAGLLPGTALAAARFVTGPGPDQPLPDPPPDAADRVARLWAATQVDVDLPHDGTPADALRGGCTCSAGPACRCGRSRRCCCPPCTWPWSPPRTSRFRRRPNEPRRGPSVWPTTRPSSPWPTCCCSPRTAA